MRTRRISALINDLLESAGIEESILEVSNFVAKN